MWLKLDTGMVEMLLLFRVLMGNQSPLASAQQELRGGSVGLLPDRQADSPL